MSTEEIYPTTDINFAYSNLELKTSYYCEETKVIPKPIPDIGVKKRHKHDIVELEKERKRGLIRRGRKSKKVGWKISSDERHALYDCLSPYYDICERCDVALHHSLDGGYYEGVKIYDLNGYEYKLYCVSCSSHYSGISRRRNKGSDILVETPHQEEEAWIAWKNNLVGPLSEEWEII